MILILMGMLWLVSISLKVMSSGINALHKVRERIALKSSEGSKDKELLNQLDKYISNISAKFLKSIALVLDVFRYILGAMLPFVLTVDILVMTVLTSAAGGYLLLLDDGTNYSGGTVAAEETTKSSKHGGKSKVILIGDSRTMQLGNQVFGMDIPLENGPAGSTNAVHDHTPDGDYIIGKGSEALAWCKLDNIAKEIDDEIDKEPKKTAVVMNMGTNGLGSQQYVEYMNDKGMEWVGKGAAVYFCATNPICEAKYTGYTNADVEKFNKEVKDGLNSKIGYIDTYSEVKPFLDSDSNHYDSMGVHYDKETYQKIWDFIVSETKGSSSDEEDEEDNSSGSLQQKVYKESLKYVGKLPYVYGGSSLETGADCSGFVGALYEKYGHPELLKDYRTADSMQNLGKEVGKSIDDLKKAKAGDILCFSGHVGIYDGDGGIVHEKDSSSGCCHDKFGVNYNCTIVSIRRVVD